MMDELKKDLLSAAYHLGIAARRLSDAGYTGYSIDLRMISDEVESHIDRIAEKDPDLDHLGFVVGSLAHGEDAKRIGHDAGAWTRCLFIECNPKDHDDV